jgi:hypothetical protein
MAGIQETLPFQNNFGLRLLDHPPSRVMTRKSWMAGTSPAMTKERNHPTFTELASRV